MSQMFTDEAWEAGWTEARSRGLTEVFAPVAHPASKADVEAIVSAVANHGAEELYVDQVLADYAIGGMTHDGAMDRLRAHMRTRLAIEAVNAGCVMITLPREVTDHPEDGLTRIRLIVPVRRLESARVPA